jgi:hypothetical protein
MSKKHFYNYLDGKNLCNILSSVIVTELQKESPDVKSEISVINVRNFFIVKGRTSSKNVIQVTDVLDEFLKTLPINPIESLRVIDTIQYNSNFDFGVLSISKTFEKINNDSNVQELIDFHSRNGLLFNIVIDEINSNLFYDCKESDDSEVFNILKKEHNSFKIRKTDLSNEVYVSDRVYGLSMNYEKPFYLLLENIKNHLFMLGISSYLDISLSSDSNYDEMTNLNVNFKTSGSKLSVNNSWLESLVLDVFPMNYNQIISELNLSNEDITKNLILTDESPKWLKLKYISEFILF